MKSHTLIHRESHSSDSQQSIDISKYIHTSVFVRKHKYTYK